MLSNAFMSYPISAVCCLFISIDNIQAEQIRKARTLRISPNDNDEEQIIIRTLSGDPPMTNELASVNAHLTVMDRLKIGESNYTVDSNIPGHGKGSGLGGVHVDKEIIDDNGNPGNVVHDLDQALVTTTPFVSTVSLPLNLPPTTPSVPLVSPPSAPLAPGGPSSPIENTFAHLATATASLPINNPTYHPVPQAADQSIDPILLDMVNYAPPANYHLPGAAVDHKLATLLTVYEGPRKK